MREREEKVVRKHLTLIRVMESAEENDVKRVNYKKLDQPLAV